MTLTDPVLLAILGGIGAGIMIVYHDLVAQRDAANARTDKYLDAWIASTRVAAHLAGDGKP